MKIFYDNYIFDYQEFGIMSRYFADVISHMPPACQVTVGVLETRNSYLSQMGFPLTRTTYNAFLNHRSAFYKKLLFRFRYSWKFGVLGKWDHAKQLNRGYSISLLKKGDFDLVHFTSCDGSLLPYVGSKPYVVTVFCKISEDADWDGNRKNAKRKMIRSAAGIITPDESVRQSVMSYYQVSPRKVFVVPFGVDAAPMKFTALSPIRAQYMVYVDNSRNLMTFGQLLKAFGDLVHECPNLKLICLGPAFTKKEQALIEDCRLSDTAIYINTRSQKEVLNIYHHAEGCITTDVSSLCIIRKADVKTSETPLLLFDGERFVQQENDCSQCLSHQQVTERLAEVYKTILRNR